MDLSNDYRRRRYPVEIVADPTKVPTPEKVSRSKKARCKWAATESSVSFNFDNLVKKVKEHIKEQFPKLMPDDINIKIGLNLKIFSLNDQTFEYTSVPNNFGGVRWFVLCPKCGKKSHKLYLPKGKDREQRYLCRYCHKLKPSSLLLGKQKKYKNVAKPLKRLEQIKKKLLHKKIKAIEAEELLEEYDRIEKKLADSPEYRLWVFKKEHGRNP